MVQTQNAPLTAASAAGNTNVGGSSNVGVQGLAKQIDGGASKPSSTIGGKAPLGKPPPSARSRWKKLGGTAMFISRLGKPIPKTQKTTFPLHGVHDSC